MDNKKKYKQGPQYDKAPTLKPIKTNKKNFFVKVVKNNKHYIFLFFLLFVLFSTKWGAGLTNGFSERQSGSKHYDIKLLDYYLIFDCSGNYSAENQIPYFSGLCFDWKGYKPSRPFLLSFLIIYIFFFFREFYFKKSN